MPTIRINALPADLTPVATDVVALDNGSTRKATIQQIVDIGAPVASQAEAETGTNNAKRMTPLTTAQAITAQGSAQFASTAQGSLASTAVQPDRTITAGAGLTGGGTLAANREIALNSTSIASLALADSAVQPEDLGTAATTDATAYATAAQGATADTAIQPASNRLVPAGGTTGQVLAKSSDTDYATAWTAAGVGDMLAATYDPQAIGGDAFDRSLQTGTQLAATISDFPAAVRAVQAYVDPIDHGATYDGTTDDRAALAAADAAAVLAGKALIITGPMRIGSAITVTSHQFYAPPGRIIPSTNVVVKLSGFPDAGLWQIFDRSMGGAVEFDVGRPPRVFVEWWGAQAGVGGRTDNEVPIQHAIDSICAQISSDFGPAPDGNNNGGEVWFGVGGQYLVSGKIKTLNRCTLVGTGSFCELVANIATWNAAHPYMWESINDQGGFFSQFWCASNGLGFNANHSTVITDVIYGPSWQEHCGPKRARIRNFTRRGIKIDNGYGGSVGVTVESMEFFMSPSSFVGATCIDVSVPYSSAYFELVLKDVTLTSGYETLPGKETRGVRAFGNVVINCVAGVHEEALDYMFELNGNASLIGVARVGGNPTTDSMIVCADGWSGFIDLKVATMGGALRLVRPFTSGANQILRDRVPFDKRVVYPCTPSHVLAAGRVTGGTATPSLAAGAYGVSGVAKNSTGLYTLTFDAANLDPATGNDYRMRVNVQSVIPRTWYVNTPLSGSVQLAFKDPATGALADAGDFDFEIYGRPGY